MITLVTGTPGAGKTLFALSEIYPQFEGRKVFADGIPELLLDHEIPPVPMDKDSEAYHKWLPDGAVLIVDECQRIWRPRASSAKVPPGVEAMETHRHQGHDLVLITQHPNLLDGNVRRLVGRHLHVRRVWGWNRAIVYEWDQATNPDRIGAATKRSWAYPKSAFGIYKSASVHTNRGQRPPWLLYMILVLPLLLGYLGYSAYSNVTQRAKPKETKMLETGQTEHPGVTFTSKYDPEQFKPVEKDVPLSAPAYNELRHVSSMPQIAGCIASKAKCICYSQQGTRLEMAEETCRKNVSNPQFDPYRMANIANGFEKNTQGQTPDHELTQTEHKSMQSISGAFEPGNMPVKKQVSGVWVDET